MLLNFFKRTLPNCLVAIISILIILWIPQFINPQSINNQIHNTNPMPLYALLLNLTRQSLSLSTIVAVACIPILLGTIIFLNAKDFFINQRSFLPALFYVLLNAIITINQTLNPVIPATIFLTFALIRIMDSYNEQSVAYSYFDAGFLIGIGSLFYANLIWYGLLLFIGILILRTVNMKEVLVAIIGLIAPLAIVSGYYYVFGEDVSQLFHNLSVNLFTRSSQAVSMPIGTLILVSFILISIIISIIDIFSRINTKKNRSRKTFFLFLWILGISLTLITTRTVSIEILWILTLPLSFFLGHYFVFAKEKFYNRLLFTGILLAVFAIQALEWLSNH